MVAFADFALIRRWRATLPTRGKAWRTIVSVGTFADFALIRHWRATFPTRGKARRTDITVVPLADFALIRRFAPPSPPGGRLPLAVRICSVLLFNLTKKSALSLTTRDRRRSLPPGGEGGAPATDEGETGERTHVTQPSHPAPESSEAKGKILRRHPKSDLRHHRAIHDWRTHSRLFRDPSQKSLPVARLQPANFCIV